ncbi:transketolase-like protein 2 isoform X2 [Uloborus diversus]|uniref:transketolase-like protein 2 isoform X1 n=1 Tax=Uloborus diversus TaxID=327109 RepID=UPI00240A5D07|nr:transketolase-like protein 2 isoform X1 [Uloborus diversus]XP_054707687.1 transketolase-like protein 2 isoform X2 [Uloborus diversus]
MADKTSRKSAQDLLDIANRLRIHSIRATNASNSGHPTSCCSMAEIMSVLFFDTMRYKISHPKDPSSDRFVLSKGHAAPILYAAWAEAGLFPEENLLTLRKIDSDLEGHPTPRLNFVDVATGSLGQGVCCAAGMAYTGKYLDKASYRVYTVLGDGESAEGSVWEALSFASHYKLDNFVAIFDVNRLGQSEPTMFQHDLEVYKKRLEAFGLATFVVDGHDVEELRKALDSAASIKDKPSAIIAKTFKGKGLPGLEDEENWHGKPLGTKAEDLIKKIQEKIVNNDPAPKAIFSPLKEDASPVDKSPISLSEPPSYNLGDMVATRLAYGTALVKLGANSKRVIALDGDTKNSTFSDKFRKAYPERFVECFIAEQNLVGIAIGCSTRGRTVPFTSTFATFYTRAFDQLRMGAISQANIKCCGSHAGISIGEDGPSQMGLEDIAMFRSVHGSTVFYPSDAVSTERACELAANTQGICFIRTSRPNTPVLYANDEPFAVGKAKVVSKNQNDAVLVIAAGVTMFETLKASEVLEKQGVTIRIIDPFTIKPLDVDTIKQHANECGGKVITVEDHYPEGGIGEAVASALSSFRSNIIVRSLAVTGLPRSGGSSQLLDMFGISANHIVKTVLELKAQ